MPELSGSTYAVDGSWMQQNDGFGHAHGDQVLRAQRKRFPQGRAVV